MEIEDWPKRVGEGVRAAEPGGRVSTSDLSGLNKAFLYPPQRSPHPNYTPDTSTLLHLLLFLTAPEHPPPQPPAHHRCRRLTIQFPALIMALPSLCLKPPGALHSIGLLVAFASQSAA